VGLVGVTAEPASHVRFRSLADILGQSGDVRFTSNSGHQRPDARRPRGHSEQIPGLARFLAWRRRNLPGQPFDARQ